MPILSTLLSLYSFVIFIRILLTWIPNLDHSLAPVQLLFQLTDPVLDLARKYIPPMGMFDLSPTIVLIVLLFLTRTLSSAGL